LTIRTCKAALFTIAYENVNSTNKEGEPMTTLTTTNRNTALILSIEGQGLDYNPAAVYLATLKPNGRRTMKQSLDLVAGMLSSGQDDAFSLDWSRIRFQHTALIRSKLMEKYKPATANRILCAVRGALKSAWRLEQMTAEDYYRARDIPCVTGQTLPAGRELTSGEICALMDGCSKDPSAAGARDAAVIALMYAAGLRREEVTKLDLDSWNRDTGKLIIQGKRSKERTAYLVNGAAAALEDWIRIRGNEPGALFVGINKGGKMIFHRLTTQAIYNLLEKRGKQAGVSDFSPHDMRRTFVSDLLDAGADIATVAKMAGHASVTTTARYDRRPEEAKRKAAGLLHVPYKGRS
jgi:integrase/recombinase XerD